VGCFDVLLIRVYDDTQIISDADVFMFTAHRLENIAIVIGVNLCQIARAIASAENKVTDTHLSSWRH
jgi:hypothetical protein